MAYIERENLIEFLRNTRLHLPKESKDFFTRDEMLLNFEQYVNLIEPAADVVEVVRCKDCGFSTETNIKLNGQKLFTCLLKNKKIPYKAYDFCSYGERKGGADND